MASTTILSLCTYFAFAHFLLLTLKCFGNRRFFLSFHSLFLWLESDVVFVSSIFCLLTDSILYFLISIYHCYQIYKKKRSLDFCLYLLTWLWVIYRFLVFVFPLFLSQQTYSSKMQFTSTNCSTNRFELNLLWWIEHANLASHIMSSSGKNAI